MKDLIAGLLIAILAVVAFYYYGQAKAVRDNPPNFGPLSVVNRVVLATQTYEDSCTHTDTEGVFGKGEIVYFWSFEFGFGLNVPKTHAWDIKEPTEGNFVISAPPLEQLHPLKIEFHRLIVANKASGKRWERMYKAVRPAALNRMKQAIRYHLSSSDELREKAKQSAEEFFAPILKEMLSDKPFNSVTVNFERADKPKKKIELISTEACVV